jgi:hypothetical protein
MRPSKVSAFTKSADNKTNAATAIAGNRKFSAALHRLEDGSLGFSRAKTPSSQR